MPSTFYETKRATYRAIRTASHGTTISLLCSASEYVATFECAQRIAAILGTRDLSEGGTEQESIPTFRIPLEDVQKSCQKLSETLSIALVDYATSKHQSTFVTVWRIDRKAAAEVVEDPMFL